MSSRGWPHLRAAYDAVAPEYAATFSDELDDKPFDRELLDRLARAVLDGEAGGSGLVCDLGCGPGQVAGYLAARGCDVIGVDISPGMLRYAQELHPDLRFQVGDMRALPLADASCAAVASFYSLIHLPRDEVPLALAEIHRVLRPGGTVVLAVHGGVDEVHVEDWFGKQVTFDATLFGADELLGLLEGAGFTDRQASQREPYPREHPTPRLYVHAKRP